ncbi:hypothetical protein BJY00DRAFT_310430 [Aspergillus carlsbadensis]|nr:hypothetical protein BJY00DRAFT_310430 [Aspergillus carlsbadensis]
MRSLPALLVAIGAVLQATAGVSAPTALEGWSYLNLNTTFSFPNIESPTHSIARRDGTLPALRVMPLGASIVAGLGSHPRNGFRGPLRQALRHSGFEVDMVGSKKDGTFADNDHEGTPGAIISETADHFKISQSLKPNVVVINVGSNDALEQVDIPSAKRRMRTLLDTIWQAEDMSSTCIFLSTLIPSFRDNGKKHNPTISAFYRELVDELESKHCIYLVEMDPLSGPEKGWISADDLQSDGVHPNNEGHRKMAFKFWAAITKANNDNKIKAPVAIDPKATVAKACKKEYGKGEYAGVTQQGSGWDDGIYHHQAHSKGVIWKYESEFDRQQFFFAGLYGQKHDDLVAWFDNRDAPRGNMFAVWRNTGTVDGRFKRIGDLEPDLHCDPRGIFFVDMNSDGLDDLVCIAENGDAYLSINQGDGTDSKPPTFKRASGSALIKKNEGFARSRIRIADIDGDGRGDYLAIDNGGNIHAWRNGWVDDIPKYWQPLGTRFTGKHKGNITGVRMVDINGDGRADWLWVSDTGEVETWTNSRTCQKGKIGDGLKVDWRQGFAAGRSSGYTHSGVDWLHPDGDIRTRILFGRVWGEPQDFGLLGRKDYAYLEHFVEDRKHYFNMRVWKNQGSGGTKVKADGVKYCNMMGHGDGREDYVWAFSNGKMVMYPNAGKDKVNNGESYWGAQVTIFDPAQVAAQHLDRRDLHLMDWDGDGDCDIVWTDPDNDNRPTVWLNHYRKTKDWARPGTWELFRNADSSASGVSCKERRGFDLHDHAVQFADIDGNGRDDYLCIRRDSHITGFIHKDDNSWQNVGQIKYAQEKDRANLRFADVNGDGLDDMIWVDKFNGDGYVWYNKGPGDRSKLQGSYIHWDRQQKPVYQSDRAGTCVYFPDLDGNGRADIHVIRDVYSNRASTWYNPSCAIANHQGDEGSCCDDPKLPVPPGASTPEVGGAPPGDETDETADFAKVYVDSSFWPPDYGGRGNRDGTRITVACQPPCIYVLPPITFGGPTTISFKPSTTVIEVGCSVSTGTGVAFTSIPVTTVLTIPATTAFQLPVSNVAIAGEIDTSTIYPQISFQADPIIITDDTAALAKAGISCLPTATPETRVITPMPWPWNSYPIATPTVDPRLEFITITHASGAPSPTATAGAGQLCTKNCGWPCLNCNYDLVADCQDGTTKPCGEAGADCAGPRCVKGGDCEGHFCTRGGDCTGPRCESSGNCKGPLCRRGGNCVGGACKGSGSCEGPLCRQGGYCGPLGKDCLKGACIGSACLPFGGMDVFQLDAAFVDPQDPKWSRSASNPITTRTSLDDAACPTPTPIGDCTTTCIAKPLGGGCARTSVACNTRTGCGTPTAVMTTVTPVALGLQ